MSANIQQILNRKIIYLYYLIIATKKIAKIEFSDLKYLNPDKDFIYDLSYSIMTMIILLLPMLILLLPMVKLLLITLKSIMIFRNLRKTLVKGLPLLILSKKTFLILYLTMKIV